MTKPAHEIANHLRLNETEQAPSGSCDNSNATGHPSDRQMLTIWQRMGELYGHRFISAYGEATEVARDAAGRVLRDNDGEPVERLTSTVETWRRALGGLTGAEIAHGLECCVTRGEEWPPTSPQFRQRCKPSRPPEHKPFDFKALTVQPAAKETALAALAKIRNKSLRQTGGAQ